MLIKKRNPTWTEAELTLALNLYFHMRVSDVSAHHKNIIDLSEELNQMRTTPGVDNKFRNPNGVAMKLHNFGRFDQTRSGEGLTHGGKGDKVV